MASASIQCKAIDSVDVLGSHYDANEDCVIRTISRLGNEHEEVVIKRSIRCVLIRGGTEQSRNLLEMVDIDLALRLNIRLNDRLKTGIASIIDYAHPIDDHTRFLYFTYSDRERKLLDESKTKERLKSLIRDAKSTYVITGIRFGLDVIIAIQLPNHDDTTSQIDAALERLQYRLENPDEDTTLLETDQNILNHINEVQAYSNVSELSAIRSLPRICQYIDKWRRDPYISQALVYTLKPIKWLYPVAGQSCAPRPLEKQNYHELEQYLIQFSSIIKEQHYSLIIDLPASIRTDLSKQFQRAQAQLQKLKDAYANDIQYFQHLILDIRDGFKNMSDLEQTLRERERQLTLLQNIDELNRNIMDLKEKRILIRRLIEGHFNYCNVAEDYPYPDNDEQTVKNKLQLDDRYDWVFCSDDTLRTTRSDEWVKLETQLLQKHEDNPALRLLYADFTYCSFRLTTMVVLASNKSNEKDSPSSSFASAQASDEIINILLLGESGVGKSTFINAFVNYLKYRTFEEAQSSTPVVLIPVSFLITTGDNFEEHTVKFGDSDALKNEDFDHLGQSVTQRCKSYVFNLNRTDGRRVRIIDTPGFGDTRGVDQDDQNIQHVLEYINGLPYLHTVCFLLKPNASRICNYFAACLQEMLDFFDENIRRNIIFCFTNARTTFYSPGDTARLLKHILQSKSMKDIPFKRENTFCFDNESFRYLVALQNNVQFGDRDRQEYQMSWSKSVHESNRFYDYICRDLTACAVQTDQPSIKRAQIQINTLIQPTLQTIKQILEDLVLCNANDKLECHFSDRSLKFNQSVWENDLDILLNASVQFAHFLKSVTHSQTDEPFWTGIVQMIIDENDRGEIQDTKQMNLQLVKKLEEFMARYEQSMEELKQSKEHLTLTKIYPLIRTVKECSMIEERMNVIRTAQVN